MREALEGLASSEGIWSLPVASERQKAGEVAPTPERDAARVGPLPTPGIKSDVPIWGIESGDEMLYFFPEGTLFHRNDRYEPVSYKALEMTLSSGRYFEEGELSSDATVLERVRRFSRPDGSPDLRHKSANFEIPVVLYNLLDMKVPPARSAPDGLQPPRGGPFRPRVRSQGPRGEEEDQPHGRGHGRGFGAPVPEGAEGSVPLG